MPIAVYSGTILMMDRETLRNMQSFIQKQQAVSITCMYCCVYSAILLTMGRDTVRNMYSFIPKIASSQHNLYDIYLLLCLQWQNPDDGQRYCPKHVEFYSKIASSQHNLYDIYLLVCVQWQNPDDGQRYCPKHVEFYSKNSKQPA